jgi:hypothetical protein
MGTFANLIKEIKTGRISNNHRDSDEAIKTEFDELKNKLTHDQLRELVYTCITHLRGGTIISHIISTPKYCAAIDLSQLSEQFEIAKKGVIEYWKKEDPSRRIKKDEDYFTPADLYFNRLMEGALGKAQLIQEQRSAAKAELGMGFERISLDNPIIQLSGGLSLSSTINKLIVEFQSANNNPGKLVALANIEKEVLDFDRRMQLFKPSKETINNFSNWDTFKQEYISKIKTNREAIEPLEKLVELDNTYNELITNLDKLKCGKNDKGMDAFLAGCATEMHDANQNSSVDERIIKITAICEKMSQKSKELGESKPYQKIKAMIAEFDTKIGWGMGKKARRIEDAMSNVPLEDRIHFLTSEDPTVTKVLQAIASHRISSTNPLNDEEKIITGSSASSFKRFKQDFAEISERKDVIEEKSETNSKPPK